MPIALPSTLLGSWLDLEAKQGWPWETMEQF